jgi:signal transduction histidine kinase
MTRSIAGRKLSFADHRTISLEYTTLDTAGGIHHLWMFHGISDAGETQQRLARSNLLLSRVTAAFSHYVAGEDPRNLFDGLLADALSLTESEYGFIGRVLINADGTPYLKTYSITNIAWDSETRELYERHHRQGMEFHNLDTLFGRVLATGEPVISNAPAEDPRRGGLPQGHPPLDAFLGIPLVSGDRLVGMLGVANRPGGYDRDLLEFLEPFLLACASIINSELADQLRQESEKRFRELYRNLKDVFTLSPDGFVSIDHDDRILMASPGFTTLTGIHADTLIGQQLSVLDEKFADSLDFAHGSASFCEVLAEAPGEQDDEEPAGDMLSLRFPRIRVLKRLVRYSDSEDSEVKAIICLRDITLETEVDRMKSEFLSTAAHELRTPMASVYGFSELLLTREFDAASSREFLETIHAQSGRLIEMLNELLDLARIESRAGKDFEMEPGDIRPLLKTAVREIAPTAGSRAIGLDMAEDLPAARFDKDKLMQVLTNVLSNAVKYSGDGNTVQIRAECRIDAEDQAWIAVAIEDDGIGMTEEAVQRICERFYRADPSGSVPGSGLGMSLVREIVDIHGGKIEIASLPGIGTTVTVLLPTADSSAPTARADNQ